MADLGLSEPYYTATENTLRRLLELRGLAWRNKSDFIVQTWSADLIKQMLDNPHSYLQAEADLRRSFNYPPYGKFWRISYRGKDPGLAALSEHIKSKIPEIKITENDRSLDIKTSKEHITEVNQELHKLDDSFIIEVNPEKYIKYEKTNTNRTQS